MAKLQVILDGTQEEMPHVPSYRAGKKPKVGVIEAIAGMPQGMQSGKTSVALSIKLKNGQWVFAETSLKMLQMAAAALSGKYGNETDSPTALAWIDGPGSEMS